MKVELKIICEQLKEALGLEENRELKHTLTTKGTESYNFIQAVISIIREEASYKEVSHPEWANKEPKITLG